MEEKHRIDQPYQSDRAGSSPGNIHFGQFELDVRAAELRKAGSRVRLQDQPFQILRMLLDTPGEVVLREEIRQKLWPTGTVVEFDHSINAAVKRLRDTLCDSAEKPRYIETLARRGYRFIGAVDSQISDNPGPLTDESSAATAPPDAAIELSDTAVASESLQAVPVASLRPTRLRKPTLLAGSVLFLILVLLAGGWLYRSRAPARWAREIAIPEAARLVNAGKYPAALPFIYRGLQVLPTDETLLKLRREISFPISIRTSPSGADVQLKPYGASETDWLSIGKSPIEKTLLPLGYFQWRITKQGFRTLEVAAGVADPTIEFRLDQEHSLPPEMVRVPSGMARLSGSQPVLDDFLIDRFEVTNKQFKQFIDQGGYREKRYWLEKFIKGDRVLSWEQGIEQFLDGTGRPGPSTWEVGNYPAGHADFPVSGVSWYEAAAYAQFAKKQLPTIYHWYRAADQGLFSDVLLFSNFGTSGPVPVGSRASIGAFGTYDIAGNVKEWCSTATGERRYILGGSWNEGRSFFVPPDALSPFDRSSANGFRCVRYPGPLPEVQTRPVDKARRDYRTESPVSDSVFRILRSFYEYDHTELNARKEAVDDTSMEWRVERISFDAAYDQQRVPALLYLPKNAKAPYQIIVYAPSGHARALKSVDDAELHVFDFLMKSGRAVLLPFYQGTFERRGATLQGPSAERDRLIQQSKDFRRSLDYLESRTDLSHDRVGFLGLSAGARIGLLSLTEETRIRAAVLAQGGFSNEKSPPETDGINFAPRFRIPVLMLNGRDDFIFPVETVQAPMLRFLGTLEKDKRYVLFDTGHAGPTKLFIKETLDWFDRYLGPVSR